MRLLDFSHLNEEQRDAVMAEEHILCCAAPGSGKTKTIIDKVCHVLSRSQKKRIMLTTFSRQAALEMREQIKKRLDHYGLPAACKSQVTIGTFHSLALLLQKNKMDMGRILSQSETTHMIYRSISDLKSDMPVDIAEEMITKCKTDPQYGVEFPEAAELTSIYQSHLARQNACDFTDIMVRCVDRLKNKLIDPIPADYVFVDEYQDIDAIQYEWLKLHLAQKCVAMAVGDDDQSIYGFRKALGHLGMMDFVKLTGARIITLGRNYRSTASILDSASLLIAHNMERVKKTLIAHRGAGAMPRIIKVKTTDDQVDHLVKQLDKICGKNKAPAGLPNASAYRFWVNENQVAVLARTNMHLKSIEKRFISLRIPYLRAGGNLWDLPVAQTLTSLLKSLDAGDSMGIEIALRWAKVAETTMDQLRAGAESENLWTLLDPKQRAPSVKIIGGPVVEHFFHHGQDWVRRLSTAESSGSQIDGLIYGVCGWMTSVMQGECGLETADNEKSPRRNVKDLSILMVLRDVLVRQQGSLAQRLMMIQRDSQNKLPRVILGTFHASKGLEWDHVFLVDVVNGVVPKIDFATGEEEIAEERRVFYVAMTRARDTLTIYTRPGEGFSEFIHETGLAHGPVEKQQHVA